MKLSSMPRRARRIDVRRKPGLQKYDSSTGNWKLKLVPAGENGAWSWTPSQVFSLVVLVGSIGLLVAALAAGRLRVYTAEVQGNHMVPASEIYRASRVDGQVIFQVNRTIAEKAIVRALPFISKARVSTRLPAEVTITVQEREPVAVWESGTMRYAVDVEGILIPAESVPGGTPLIQALDGRPIQPGEHVPVAAVNLVLQLRALLPNVSTYQFQLERGVGFKTAQGWPVWLGTRPDNLEVRIQTLAVLVRQLEAERAKIEYIDLRFKQPYYKTKS